MTNATLGEPEYRDDSVRWDGALQHGQRGRLGSGTAHFPGLLGPTRHALCCAPHSRGATQPLRHTSGGA